MPPTFFIIPEYRLQNRPGQKCSKSDRPDRDPQHWDNIYIYHRCNTFLVETWGREREGIFYLMKAAKTAQSTSLVPCLAASASRSRSRRSLRVKRIFLSYGCIADTFVPTQVPPPPSIQKGEAGWSTKSFVFNVTFNLYDSVTVRK
jgi:hypothetical protein